MHLIYHFIHYKLIYWLKADYIRIEKDDYTRSSSIPLNNRYCGINYSLKVLYNTEYELFAWYFNEYIFIHSRT